MKILVKENQLRFLILEETSEKITNELIKSDKLGKKIIKNMISTTGIDYSMLFTYSCAIGGFFGPLNEFITSGEFSASERDITLITAAIVSSYFLGNSSILKKIMKIIKDSNLEDFYNFIDNKASILKSVFIGFIDSLGILVGRVSNMMAFTFLIPVIGPFLQLCQMGDLSSLDEIVKRITLSGVVNLSGITIRETIKRLVKRFSD
jgi:hypothetical protein